MKKIRLAGLIVLTVIIMATGRQANAWMSLGDGETDTGNDARLHTIEAGRDQLYRGDLILVDRDHPVRENGKRHDIVNLFDHPELRDGYGVMDTTVSLSQRVAWQWQQLVDAAGKRGIHDFVVTSGYRDAGAQTQLNAEEGQDDALPPEYNEHHTGLSMDIALLNGEMNKSPGGKWLSKHAWEYGFVLHLPKDKKVATDLQIGSWHLRYVGLPHSALINQHHWTLEEYLAALKERKTMTAAMDGMEYTVTYYPAPPAGNTAVSVPIEGAYMISGDNEDGIIVTIQTRAAADNKLNVVSR